MKIKKLKLNNFAKFTDFECEFDGNVTHLVGVNGSGKTTVGLTAIWACLKGIAEKSKDGQLIGERFRFIGSNRPTADVTLTVLDETTKKEVTITNHITKDGNKISCQPVQDSAWLSSLLSVAFLSAKNFTQLTGKEQALLLGIDTSEHDAKIKSLKEAYTFINREYRGIGDINQAEKVDKVSITDLLRKKESADLHNEVSRKHSVKAEDYSKLLAELEIKEVSLIEELEQVRARIGSGKKEILMLQKPEPMIDTSPILDSIQNAESTNHKAAEYDSYLEKKKTKDLKEQELRLNKQRQEEAVKARIEFIKSSNLGFNILTIDDDGELRMDNRPVREPYFSKGELEIVVAKLHASRNPDLKVRFIDDFELLDEGNQTRLINDLLKEGFQVITAEVGAKKTEGNTLLLRECAIVNEY